MGFLDSQRPKHVILPGKPQSLWTAFAPETNYPALSGEVEADVAIVGAGIVGTTAARLLTDSGLRVALIEADRIGRQATALSTAKVTSQHGLIYDHLIRSIGEERARVYAEAQDTAVNRIAELVRQHSIDCDLDRKAAYVYVTDPGYADRLHAEADAARRLDLPATFVRSVDGLAVAAAVRFDDQAQIDAARYLIGLAASAADDGCLVFEHSRVQKVLHGMVCRVETDAGSVSARHVILSSHLPVIPEGKYSGKVQPIAHPMLAAQVDEGAVPDGMFLSVDGQPSHSFRTLRRAGQTWVIAVGGTHRPGDADASLEMFQDLEQFVRTHFGVQDVPYRWTNEDYNSPDRVPLVGCADAAHPHFLVATGFGAWGITNGTAAAMILAGRISGTPNAWTPVFDSERHSYGGARVSAAKEKSQMLGALLGGFLKPRPHEARDLLPGEGAVLSVKDEKIAVHRDDSGTLHAVSATCTHLGCTLGWNPVGRTWDCGCHGSRFAVDGDVIHGPAKTPLEKKSL